MSALDSIIDTLDGLSNEFGFKRETDQALWLINGVTITENVFRTTGAAVFARYLNHHRSRPKEFIFELMMRELAHTIRIGIDEKSLDALALYDIRINGQPRDLLAKVEAYKESQHARNQILPQE